MKEKTTQKMKNFKKDFKKISDYVIVDSAAGLGIEASSAIELADELIIVTNPEMPALTDALKTVKFAEQMKKPVRGIIVTRVRNDNIELKPEVVKEMLENSILGMIPEDDFVKRAVNCKKTVVHEYQKSKASRAYKEIAAKILNVEYDSKKDKEKFFEKLRRFLKKED